VIVTSPTTGRRIVELGVDTNRARVVKPGTDPADPASGPGPGAPPRLLCVGTVTPRKGQDLLVQALVSLREEEWDCVCVGSVERDAAFAESVIGAVRSAGLEERIRFTGEVTPERLDEEWRAASVFVSPSWYEGYGMALTEAVARGLPIITTRGGAIPETVPEAVAIRIETGDVDALTTAISTLVRDPEARAERAAAARHLAASLPRWPEQADRFHRAVEELTDVT
jgi:glycosyltransferase involved in cell wall biosynthesis